MTLKEEIAEKVEGGDDLHDTFNQAIELIEEQL